MELVSLPTPVTEGRRRIRTEIIGEPAHVLADFDGPCTLRSSLGSPEDGVALSF